MGSANARRRLLRAGLVVGQFRIRQWLVVIECQFFGFIQLLRFLVGKFVLEQFVGKLLGQQRIIRKFFWPIEQYAIQQRLVRERASKLRDHL